MNFVCVLIFSAISLVKCLEVVNKRSALDTLHAEIAIVEEQDVDSSVNNLNSIARQALEQLGHSWTNLQPSRFTLLEPNSYFKVGFTEGTNDSFLMLKSRLDREQLCATDGICCINGDSHNNQRDFDNQHEMSKSDCTMSLILLADFLNFQDESNEQRLVSISLRILDLNDNPPSWSSQYTRNGNNKSPAQLAFSDVQGNPAFASKIPVLNIPIREHTKIGTKIELPQALDPDAYPENTTAYYGIDSETTEGLFSLKWDGSKSSYTELEVDTHLSKKLWLILNKEIDRDLQSSYQLKIFAVDGNIVKPQTGFLLLNITVEDVNNNPPKFEKSEDLIWVLEHSPISSVIYKLRAGDKDESDLDKLEYTISNSASHLITNLFAVDLKTGEVRLQGDLDYERQIVYKVPVTVTDGLWFDEALLTICLLNINDHPPSIMLHSHLISQKFPPYVSVNRIPSSQIIIEVKENGPPDQLIATFTVTDRDDAAEERFLQTNSPIREAFLRSSGLTLQQAIERISQPQRCKLNSDLMQIELIGTDRSPKTRFQLRLANKPLDREVSGKYLIRIECWDQANRFGNHILAQSNTIMGGFHNSFTRSTSVMFTLIVLDENDSLPQFIGQTTGSISEGLPSGTLIMQLSAKDADDPYTSNGQAGLRFEITSNPVITYSKHRNITESLPDPSLSSSWFTLNSRSGELRSAIVFDRELVTSFNLTINVTDGGEVKNTSLPGLHNSALTTIQILIEDINDCTPIFDQLIYELNVSEGAIPPLLIGQLQAHDCDDDDANKRLHYWLQQPKTYLTGNSGGKPSSTASRWFTISRSGELYLGAVTTQRSSNNQKIYLQDWRPLDREKEEMIILDVCARDHGQPPLTGSAQVIIRVQDINDNSPVWQFPRSNERIINVSLDAAVGQRIAQLSATDSDEGDRGKISYALISGNEEGHFELDELSGWLYIGKAFYQDIKNTSAINDQTKFRMLSLKTFRLYLRAVDGGDPQRSTTAVLDVRLFRPSFTSKSSATSNLQKFTPAEITSSQQLPVYHKSDSSYPVFQLRQQPQNQLPSSPYPDKIDSDDQLIASESSVIIAVMVAAVAALLFIVVLLTAACMRKRFSGSTGDARSTGREGEPLRLHKSETGKSFELRFTPSGPSMTLGRNSDLGSSLNKGSYSINGAGCMQLQDGNSAYVTVTRNSLRNNNGILSIPQGMTATYGVHSLDNLDSCQNEILNPYRYEKRQSPCGILLRDSSSNLLAVGLSPDTQFQRIGSPNGESFESESGAISGVTGILKPTPISSPPPPSQTMTATTSIDSKLYPPPPFNNTTPSLQRANKGVNNQSGCILPPASYVTISSACCSNDSQSSENGKCISFVAAKKSDNSKVTEMGPFLIKLQSSKLGSQPEYLVSNGSVGQSEGRTYTPLNFIHEASGTPTPNATMTALGQPQIEEAEELLNQESSFV